MVKKIFPENHDDATSPSLSHTYSQTKAQRSTGMRESNKLQIQCHIIYIEIYAFKEINI